MPDNTTTELLVAVLATIRERGPIGEASLVAAVQRADAFVALVPSAAQHVVDLGSGGGLPGLVIAARRADLMVTLVERRTSVVRGRRAVGATGTRIVRRGNGAQLRAT
jgi:methylase of polypeptide subunit release factors